MSQEAIKRYQAIFERLHLPKAEAFSLSPRQATRFETPTYLIEGDHELLMKIIQHPDLGKDMQHGIIQCAGSDWYRMSDHDSRVLEWNICRLERPVSFAHRVVANVGTQASHTR